MGMLSNLLPGLRDLRTPLTAGYVSIVGLWLIFADVAPVRDFVGRLATQLAPLNTLLGAVGLLGAISAVAYLLGSLFTVDASRVALRGYEQWMLHPVEASRFAGDAMPLDTGQFKLFELSVAGTRRQIRQGGLNLRYRVQDLERLAEFVGFRPSFIGLISAFGQSQRHIDDAGSGRDSTPVTIDGQVATALKEELLNLPYQFRETFAAIDPTSLAIRLHIEKQELWDQYDRLEAEAELRLALVLPLGLVALGVAWRGVWWAGPIVLVLAILLYRVGDSRARAANGVLIQCIVTEVISEAGLVDLKERLSRITHALRAVVSEGESDRRTQILREVIGERPDETAQPGHVTSPARED